MKHATFVSLILLLLFITPSVRGQKAIEFNLEVVESSNVQFGENQIGNGQRLNEENYSEVTFGEDSYLVVRNRESGIKYRVETSSDLAFLGNALGKATDGTVIARWVVGGSVESNERSTLSSLKSEVIEGFSEEPSARLGIQLQQVNPPSTSATPSSP